MLADFFSGGRRSWTVPIFPLNAVLFPAGALPMRIFEARYMDMASDCLRRSRPFGVCLIREGEEVGAPAVPERVGCLARIADCDAGELGVLKVRAEGGERFRITSSKVTSAGLIVAEVEELAAEPVVTEAPGLAECSDFLRKVIAGIGEERFVQPFELGDASWVGFRLAEILPLRNDVRQKLLELTDAALRLAVIHRFLRQQGLLGAP